MNIKTIVGGAFIFALAACNSNPTEMTDDTTEPTNPLLMEWDTPFGVPPFDVIQNADYLPAFEQSMADQLAEIDAIVANQEEPTFKNTVEAYELSGAYLKRTSNVFYAVEAANTNTELQETAGKVAPKLAAHSDAILLNDGLFQRVKAVYDNREAFELSDEENRLLDETYKKFVRAGANVQGEDKERLKEINARLASLGTQFGDNLLAETNAFELHLTDEADVADLPASLRAMAKEEAQKRGYESGWVFTTQRPSCNPFLQSSTNRDYRKQMFDGYMMRANNDNAHDNKAIVVEMANLRLERANLLGLRKPRSLCVGRQHGANA